MQIENSDSQLSNADCSKRRSFGPFSNVTVLRLRQPEKQHPQRRRTLEGMQIDLSDEQPKKADSPTSLSLEPPSKATPQKLPSCQKL
jgi:hypothetical protein